MFSVELAFGNILVLTNDIVLYSLQSCVVVFGIGQNHCLCIFPVLHIVLNLYRVLSFLVIFHFNINLFYAIVIEQVSLCVLSISFFPFSSVSSFGFFLLFLWVGFLVCVKTAIFSQIFFYIFTPHFLKHLTQI